MDGWRQTGLTCYGQLCVTGTCISAKWESEESFGLKNTIYVEQSIQQPPANYQSNFLLSAFTSKYVTLSEITTQ